mmetsp:Transcript_13786/g.21014  ORF Transcript_13786/g.21014 Transcript_13786/m.21014 type:complete len:276 (+) Transcript_13786:157-984(+)
MTELLIETVVDTVPAYETSDETCDGGKCSLGGECNESFSVSSGDASTKPVRRQRKKRKQSRRKKKKSANPLKKEIQISQEEKERYVALDCEMVGVGYGGHRSSLARVCVVDWDGNTILDLYVRQRQEVTDYRTFVSGITEKHLSEETAVDIEECRRQVQEIVSDKILVGHALKNDLSALKISHAWHQLRDTGKYEPFMKVRFDDGILWPRKLKDLAKEKLGLEIQSQGCAHCPCEDAKAALSLYKKVRNKWEKAMDYKLKKTKEIQEKNALKVSE